MSSSAAANPWKRGKRRKAKSVLRGRGGNLDAQRKEFNAYDFLCRQQECKEWIQECIGEELPGGSVSNFMLSLKNGVYLCKLANSFAPGSVPRIHEKAKMEFQYTENINFFLQACLKVGLPKMYLFAVPDLYEMKNSVNVVHCINTLSNHLETQGLAPKMKSLQGKVEFNEEELKRANEELKKIAETAQAKASASAAQEPDEVFAAPEQTEVEGEGLQGCVAGETVSFTLRSKDANGKPFENGGDSFSVTLTNKETGHKFNASIVDHDDGSYTASYTIKEAGEYNMEILMDDIPIRDHPFEVIVKPKDQTKSSKSIVEGTGAKSGAAGSESTFIIQARDEFGNNRKEGGDTFTATLTKGDKIIPTEILDFGNGQYSVTYTCPESGTYELAVRGADGELVEGCPYQIKIKDAGISDPTKCTIIGENINKAIAGKTSKIILQAYDKLGNARESGGEDFMSILTHTTAGHIVDVDVRDLENGKYELSFVATDAAEYELEVVLGESVVSGTPFKIQVESAKRSHGASCTISGEGASVAKAGIETSFFIEARDKFGNMRKEGGEEFRATIVHEDDSSIRIEATIKDLADGRYECSYTATKSGEYRIDVQHKFVPPTEEELREEEAEKKRQRRGSRRLSQDIASKEQALLSSLAAEIDAETKKQEAEEDLETKKKQEEEEEAAKQKQAEAEADEDKKKEDDLLAELLKGEQELNAETGGEEKKLEQQEEKKDEDENVEKGSSGVETPIISIDSPKQEEEKKPEETAASSTSSSTAEMMSPGSIPEWERVGLLASLHVKVEDSGETDPEHCELDLSGLQGAISGEEISFVIRSRDKFGNLRHVGGDKFGASMFHKKTGNKLATVVTDVGDGTYKISFTPKDWGDYHLDVKLRKQKVGEQATIHVAEPVSIRAISNDEFAKLSDFDLMRTLKAEAEDDDGEDVLVELQQVKEQVIKQIRENAVLEADLKKLDRKIELLIRNRVSLQEVMQSSKKLNKLNRDQGKGGKGKNKGGNKDQGKGTVLEDKKKLEAYSNFFYLLQTEPSYLARCVFLVTDRVDDFLETVILTLYGYAFSPREEFLILNLFKMALEYEVSSSGTVGGFLETNPIVTKMVLTYGSRLQGQEFLRDSLCPMIKNILQDQELNLEINPTKVFKDIISAEETKTGQKSTIKPSEINDENAWKDPKVKAVLEQRIALLTQKCDMFITGIIAARDKLPYGLRWISKTLAAILKKQYPDSTDEAILNIIAYLVYYRFMNPVIIQPDEFKLTTSMINQTTRRNLVLIAKVLQGLTNNTVFGTSSTLEKFMDAMNPFITQNYGRVFQYFKDVCNVDDLEEALGVNRYVDLTQKMDPSISISINEMLSTHRVVRSFVDKLAPKQEDPLRVILNKLGDPSQPVPEELDEEMNLPLVNGFIKDVGNAEQPPAQVYEETKELVRHVLKSIPVENFFPTLNETLDKSKKWAQARMRKGSTAAAAAASAAGALDGKEDKKDKKKQQEGGGASKQIEGEEVVEEDDDDDDDGQDWADSSGDEGENDTDKASRRKGEAEAELLCKRINMIFENLKKLEASNIASKLRDDFASLLRDIAKDARNRNEHKARQKKDLDRMKASLKELEEHFEFLKEQNGNFMAYLNDVKDKSLNVSAGAGKKNKRKDKKSAGNNNVKLGPFKYTYAQLEKQGVILSLDVPSSQRKNVKFSISSESVGVFDVAAQFSGVTLKTIQLEMDDLLEKQYNGVDKLDFEYVTLDVNMTLWLFNRLATSKS